MARTSHRPADPTRWHTTGWRERVRRKAAVREALEAADPLWWCNVDPLVVYDPLVTCQSLFRRNAGLSVATGPGRLP